MLGFDLDFLFSIQNQFVIYLILFIYTEDLTKPCYVNLIMARFVYVFFKFINWGGNKIDCSTFKGECREYEEKPEKG